MELKECFGTPDTRKIPVIIFPPVNLGQSEFRDLVVEPKLLCFLFCLFPGDFVKEKYISS